MDFPMGTNEYQLLQNQSQMVAPYQQLQFTPVPANNFNPFHHPQTSTSQVFTNYNHVTTPAEATWQSSATTTTSATSLLRARLLQQSPSVSTELSEVHKELLKTKEELKVSSEKNTILEKKVRELEDTKDNEIRLLKASHSLEKTRRKCEESKLSRLNHQFEELQEKFDWAEKEIELLNQSDEKKKIEKFRIKRIKSLKSIYPNAVDLSEEKMRHYFRPLTEAEEEEILAQIEAEEKSASTKNEASEVSASSSIKTYPSSSSSSSPVRLEAMGKDGKKHGICPESRGRDQMCLCGGRFSHRGNLITHILQRTKGGGEFSCNVCEKRFDGTGNLRAHVKKVHKYNLPFSVGCRLCGHSFVSYSQLYEHRTFEHGTTKSAAKAKVSKSSGGKRRQF